MTTLDAAISGVSRGPRGPKIGAFFDFDGTLIEGFSVTEFYRHRFRKGEIGLAEGAELLLRALRGVDTDEQFRDFAGFAFKAFAGKTEAEMDALGELLCSEAIARSLFPQSWELIEAHRKMGHTLVIATSATHYQVAPMARELGIEHLLSTGVELKDGALTGRMLGEPTWGEGKANAVRRFAKQHGIALGQSYAYGNGNEDVAYLETVGHPCPINPEPHLAEVAAERSWPTLHFPARQGITDVRTVVRSGIAYAGMAVAAVIGIAAGLLNGDRREAINHAMSLTGEVGLALAGIRLEVQGEENLWVRRPAVFAFNHQSQLDVLIMLRLLRENFTGIAKAHTRNVPGFGQFFQFAGVAFVEPGEKKRNREAVAPAVDKLKDGLSLVIAPEGTRTPTPRLAPFKKGAFYIAMQAGVPIVPVVIRDAGALMRRGEKLLRAGTVQVAVLPPIPTTGWTEAAMAKQVEFVRNQFVATLANWPTAGGAKTRKEPLPRPATGKARRKTR